jgi:hypothetical protein
LRRLGRDHDAGAVGELVSARSRLNFTAAASNGSPSWKSTPGRSLKVIALPSAAVSQLVASIGTIEPSGAMSTSLSQIEVITTRPTKLQFLAPSRVSGSSCRPMRKVCAAAGVTSARTATQAASRTRMCAPDVLVASLARLWRARGGAYP